MNKARSFLTIALLWMYACTICLAQKYAIRAGYPNVIANDSNFRISYCIEGLNADMLSPDTPYPKISNAEIIRGPYVASQSSYSTINGVSSITHQTKMTYTLAPNCSNCDIVVDSMEFKLANDSVYLVAPPIVIKVQKGHKDNRTRTEKAVIGQNKKERKITSPADITPDDIFVKWTLSKDKVNLGDTLHCYWDLYTKLDIINPVNIPQTVFNDCYIEEDSLPTEYAWDTIQIKGIEYKHIRWYGYKLTPLRAGHFKISSEACTFMIGSINSNIDNFEAFFNGIDCTTFPYTIKPAPIEFKVLPLHKQTTTTHALKEGKTKTYLLCDISGSMDIDDMVPNRGVVAREFADTWLAESQNCGLITFARNIESFQRTAVKTDDKSFPDTLKHDGTALGDVLLALTAKGEKARNLVLVTDGANNSGHFTLQTAMEILRSQDVRVYYIYLNSCTDSIDYPMTITDDDSTYISKQKFENAQLTSKQQKEISKLVSASGGMFMTAKSKDELMGLIPKIQSAIALPLKKNRYKLRLDSDQVKIALKRLEEKLE